MYLGPQRTCAGGFFRSVPAFFVHTRTLVRIMTKKKLTNRAAAHVYVESGYNKNLKTTFLTHLENISQ